MSDTNYTSDTLQRLAGLIEGRKLVHGGDPTESYVARLFAKGDDAILKKIGEEATETVMAAKDARIDGDTSKLVYECADLWFHSLIMLAQFDLTPQHVLDEQVGVAELRGTVDGLFFAIAQHRDDAAFHLTGKPPPARDRHLVEDGNVLAAVFFVGKQV